MTTSSKRDPFLEGIMNRSAKEIPLTAAPKTTVETPRNWRRIVDDVHPKSLEPFYSNWVDNLTKFDLHAKADIAIVLSLLERELAQAATALSLAQAEIKGHMRVVDELKAHIAELEKAIVGECVDCGQTILTPLHPLPSVEKDAARYRWLRDTPYRKASEMVNEMVGYELDAAIDAALKDRA